MPTQETLQSRARSEQAQDAAAALLGEVRVAGARARQVARRTARASSTLADNYLAAPPEAPPPRAGAGARHGAGRAVAGAGVLVPSRQTPSQARHATHGTPPRSRARAPPLSPLSGHTGACVSCVPALSTLFAGEILILLLNSIVHHSLL